MQKILDIQKKYKISYQEISNKISELWETSTSVSNLHKIFTEKTGMELATVYKILSAINNILKKRGINIVLTPNDILDYEDYLI